MAVIGIDLGTTYSAAARVIDGRPEIILLEGEPKLPSVVGLQKSGKIAVGKTAKRNQAKYPQDTIVEIKRKMGENVAVRLGDKTFKPQEISAMILRKIIEETESELGEEVTGAVISCPVYFKEPARQAIQEAGELAGLKVLRIINEPTAAAYAYGIRADQHEQKEQLYLVYDLGGSTFDMTVIRMCAGSLAVIGTGGDPVLGGGNFDERIVDWLLNEHIFNDPDYAGYKEAVTGPAMSEGRKRDEALRLRLKSYAEEGKKQLCVMPAGAYHFYISGVDVYQGRPVVLDAVLTMAKFEDLIRDLLEHSLQCVDEALSAPKEKYNYTETDLTAILLVGGSTRVPLVRRLLAQRFPNTPIYGQEQGINPDEIVALGASLVAAEQDPESDEVSEHLLMDVTGHTLSVADETRQESREGASEGPLKMAIAEASEAEADREKPLYTDENVQFTVYRPEMIAPLNWYTLLAFAHLSKRRPDAPPDAPEPITEVKRIAERVLADQPAKYEPLKQDSLYAVPHKGEITFVPMIEGFEFNPPSQSFFWQKSVHKVEFEMRATAQLDGHTARGRLTVFLGSIILADVPLAIRVDSAQGEIAKTQPVVPASATPYRKIFASYSHRDREIVEQIEHHIQALGDKYLRDVTELRSGQDWQRWMKDAISEADVFQLFWSHNAMRSAYVREEWEYALALARPNFVRPIYWETPLPESPTENLPP